MLHGPKIIGFCSASSILLTFYFLPLLSVQEFLIEDWYSCILYNSTYSFIMALFLEQFTDKVSEFKIDWAQKLLII